jgi:hypothetical protein
VQLPPGLLWGDVPDGQARATVEMHKPHINANDIDAFSNFVVFIVFVSIILYGVFGFV